MPQSVSSASNVSSASYRGVPSASNRLGRAISRAASVALLLGLSVVYSGCETPVWVLDDAFNQRYYTRSALRGTQSGPIRTLYSSGYLDHLLVIPPGQEVTVNQYSAIRVDMTIHGIQCQMHPVDGRFPVDKNGIAQFVAKYFVTSKEELALDELDTQNRNMIDRGEAAISMTKNEVLLALGYPRWIDGEVPTAGMERDRILQSDHWLYRTSGFEFFGLGFVAACMFDPATGQLIDMQR